MKNFLVTLILVSPLFASQSFADISAKFCGRVSSAESNQGAYDIIGNGYFMRVDCNKDGKIQNSSQAGKVPEPIAYFETFATPGIKNVKGSDAARRGWVTRYTRAEANRTGSREKAVPYVCFDANVSQDPCGLNQTENTMVTGVRKMTADRQTIAQKFAVELEQIEQQQ